MKIKSESKTKKSHTFALAMLKAEAFPTTYTWRSKWRILELLCWDSVNYALVFFLKIFFFKKKGEK